MHTEHVPEPYGVHRGRTARWAARGIWTAALAVALAAAAATAHGLYEVVRSTGTPAFIAGLYPLITDGLALVAYSATARLNGPGRRYAWTIVVLAAGLSGLAQATYLAGTMHGAPGWLRAGVGAWPAVAAAVVAHLLYLLGSVRRTDPPYAEPYDSGGAPPVSYEPYTVAAERTDTAPNGWSPSNGTAVQPAVRPERARTQHPEPVSGSARERARKAARAHRDRNGDLPTATVLMELAGVGRGTAGAALKQLRTEPTSLHLVTPDQKENPEP